MTHHDPNGNGNGRGRWYDSTIVIWGLFVVIGGLLAAMAGVAWSSACEANRVNSAQDVRIERLQVVLEGVSLRLNRMETKQDLTSDKIDELLRRAK